MILGIGTDIIEIDRIKKAIERFGDDFLRHILTDEEITHARRYQSPYAHYAGRFAAKEAIFKALGDPKLSWHDINIINDKEGKPVCKHRQADFKNHILISISHSKDYAVASAIVET
ncbi:MAG: holo-ACP synthase [Candidatus Omnitrophica bacterium]|nr:holo-ACP synthase [Candidatus Omnitrophota bacterium]